MRSVHNGVFREEGGHVLLIDKPLDWTSFDVVRRVKLELKEEKVGHAGTLDPKATGLLIVCTGRKTKEFDRFAGLDKEYTGTFQLGISTPSYDLETEITEEREYRAITLEQICDQARRLTGRLRQVPPMFSAVKHKGKPLYKIARKGKSIEREPKEIEVREFEIGTYEPPTGTFRIVCSKGTYIRSLIHDLGVALGCGAVLTSLRRTRIGTYRVDDALTIEQLPQVRDHAGAKA